MMIGKTLIQIAMMACVGLSATALPADLAWGKTARCHAGAPRCPIAVHLRRGGPAVVVRGRVRHVSDDFNYAFRARAGETLLSAFHGPAARLVIHYPDGDADGPGFAERLRLHQTGRYRIEITPDTMADGIFGRFRLSLRLR